MPISKSSRIPDLQDVADRMATDKKYVPGFQELGLGGRFAGWVARGREMRQQKEELESKIKEFNSMIEAEIAKVPMALKSVLVGNLRVTVADGCSVTINKEALLELGVPADTIIRATKRTPYVTVSITEVKS